MIATDNTFNMETCLKEVLANSKVLDNQSSFQSEAEYITHLMQSEAFQIDLKEYLQRVFNKQESSNTGFNVEEYLGFAAPRACGYQLILRVFMRPEDYCEFKDEITGETKKLILTTKTLHEDRYSSWTGRVIAMGPNSYTGKKRFPSGPYCNLGDWVVIDRTAATLLIYRNIPILFIPDDRILGIVEDPAYVIRE